MMKIKKLSALIMAGMIVCTAPSTVMASSSDEIQSAAQEILESSEIDSLLSDPDKVVDIIMYVKDLVDQQDISENDISQGVDMALEHFQISLTDSDKESLVSIATKIKDMDLDEEQLRSQVKLAYDTLDSLGVEKEDVKNILEKTVDFVKSLFD